VNDPAPRLPDWIVRGGGAAWRLLAMGAVVYFGFQILRQVSVVVLAVVLALFPSAVLWGPVRRLERRGWRPMPATALVLTAFVLILVAGGAVVIPPLVDQMGPIAADIGSAAAAVRGWLSSGPLGFSPSQIDAYWTGLVERFNEGGGLSSGLLGGATAIVEIVTGLFVMLICTFFILKDGPAMTGGLLARMSERRAIATGKGIDVAWRTLGHYVRGLAVVGLVDATVIGIGLLVVGVPMVIPLAILTFFGAFFPLVGAWVAGLAAVAVAFGNGGIIEALIVLAIITAVQQLEGDLVLPFVFGRTLLMHPLVVLLAVAAGGIAFGIAGAFLSVPAVAVAVAVRQEIAENPASTFTSLVQGVEAAQEPVPDDEPAGNDDEAAGR
jgi:putative heme transporter